MMAEWWWFLIINAVVAAIAVLSSLQRPPLSSPRRGGVTRRASSVVLQRLRSFPIFSFPSACFPFLQPDAAASQETEEPAMASPTKPSPRALALAPPPAPAAENEDEDDEDPNAMSMEEVYALVLAGWRRPEREREEEARRSEVDGQEEEFIRGFREDQRQQRLNSIFNYTQMLKQRALAAAGRRQPDARPDQL
ncbi:uncharacterized protein LOC133901992 [Phragmites australis]|uniref:uncharacterized protein LOC133901992 n=1 Tax=Phragmites australis TaxID=29695 RepID=UPI002D7792AC|nr:uncharacterized protein LOC133901992 [Phragmites australis]